MASRLWWALAGMTVLALQPGTASAQEPGLESPQEFFDWRVCARHKHGALSEDERAGCEIFNSLDRHGRYKAIVMQRLRRWNKPPVAAIEILDVLPRRVDVSAEGSTDEDGFPELYHFSLEDADTGDVLAGPMTTREPVASLETNRELPQNLRVWVVVEDDLRAIDTAEEMVTLSATQCSNEYFDCDVRTDGTRCTPRAENNAFTTGDVLDAGQRCTRTITKDTQVTITARGGAGGRGANALGSGGAGGRGGAARMVTTLNELDRVYGSGTTYCYGIGDKGSFTDTRSGSGGAATLLRTCNNVSQTAITGVLLIAGGGSGGRAAALGDRPDGDDGGVAASSAAGSASGAGAGRGGDKGKGGLGVNRGQDGVGGKGGSSVGLTAGWTKGNPRVEGSSGQGGEQCAGAGGGGGGWGGGACDGIGLSGGGGSYAAAGLSTASSPVKERTEGSLRFVFAP